MKILKSPVSVAAPDGRQTSGTIEMQSWDQSERTKKALKTLALCWVGAIVSVVLPIAHFVLVPGLFLAGIILAFNAYGTSSAILGGEAPCPSCGARLTIVRQADRWPLTELCTKCQKNMTVTKSS